PTFAQFGQNLSVDQIEYFLEFQKYPKTLSTGVASVYNVSGRKPDDAKKHLELAIFNILMEILEPFDQLKNVHSW
ncbi:2761_t:CDS:1, partial [Gigaspora rosea]